ncbi:protein NDUFAF4 homolog [Phlebotomus argentipes]|uniref:protein NDUFAF4 homolog n=1 Tax=Phlebotomus argentipes TaxID=94469 RepID=UPI002892EF1F|nr:protein NDUFAF4 homolog [Phlebotomus argentipes]
MGQVGSMISRRANRFNAENRAHRIIARDKPTPAPKYESNLKDLQKALEITPDLVEKLSKKDVGLDDRLKQVYVTSETTIVKHNPETQNIDRPLPMDTKRLPDFEFGHKDPEYVTPGKVTMQQISQFLADHERNRDLWTVEKIAEHYKLPLEKARAIVKHFRAFQVYVPDIKSSKKILEAGPQKVLPESKSSSDESNKS